MLISVDERDPRPLYAQIVGSVKEQIRQGFIRPGDDLPSVRELAESLGVNLHTVHHAYQTLREQGVINLRLGQRARGAAARLTPASPEQVDRLLVQRLKELVTEAFHLGLSKADFRKLVDDVIEGKDDGGRET
jgi:GntR family transcriptional regulator